MFIDGDWLQAATRPPIDFRNLLARLRHSFGADLTPTLQFTVRDQQGRDLAARDLDTFMRGHIYLSPLMRGGQALSARDQPLAP